MYAAENCSDKTNDPASVPGRKVFDLYMYALLRQHVNRWRL